MTKIITVTHFRADRYDRDYPPKSLLDFSNWLAQIVDSIPANFRDTAIITVHHEGREPVYPVITVKYARPETDVERVYREMAEEVQRHQQETAERVSLETLKRKYRA